MAWFLFGRKKEDDVDKKLDVVEGRIKSSFNNVKDTFENIKSWLNHLNQKDQELDKKIEHILGKLDVIERSLFKNQPVFDEEDESIPPKLSFVKAKTYSLENLTETQRQMLGLVIRLIAEKGLEWIYAKDIAAELYHDQPYEQVRSTISEYLRYLEDEGLIKRRRRGKQIQVTITDIGKSLKLTQKNLLRLKKKNNLKGLSKD